MTTEAKIQQFMQEFRVSYMIASDWLFASDDNYEKARRDYISWTAQP